MCIVYSILHWVGWTGLSNGIVLRLCWCLWNIEGGNAKHWMKLPICVVVVWVKIRGDLLDWRWEICFPTVSRSVAAILNADAIIFEIILYLVIRHGQELRCWGVVCGGDSGGLLGSILLIGWLRALPSKKSTPWGLEDAKCLWAGEKPVSWDAVPCLCLCADK